MKKVLFVYLALFAFLLSGCNSFQISGLDNFTEDDCCFGLNDMLLPGGRNFLDDYPYQDGNYQYWRNNYGAARAKTFVQIFYSEELYQQAKLKCVDYFFCSEEQYHHNEFVMHVVDVAEGELTIHTAFPGVRMFGYNDEECSLIFFGYLNDSSDDCSITASEFSEFFHQQFGEWFERREAKKEGGQGTVCEGMRERFYCPL